MQRIFMVEKKYILLALYDAIARLGYEIVNCNSGLGYLDIGDAKITLTDSLKGINVCITSNILDKDSALAILDETSAILLN